MQKLKAVKAEQVSQKDYATAKEVAKDICDWVKRCGKSATLATNRKWWSKAIVSPYEGAYVNWSIGYPTSISEDELVEAIYAEGCCYKPYMGSSGIALVAKGIIFSCPPIMGSSIPDNELPPALLAV